MCLFSEITQQRQWHKLKLAARIRPGLPLDQEKHGAITKLNCGESPNKSQRRNRAQNRRIAIMANIIINCAKCIDQQDIGRDEPFLTINGHPLGIPPSMSNDDVFSWLQGNPPEYSFVDSIEVRLYEEDSWPNGFAAGLRCRS
jgi:hypothetical protein